MKDAERLAKKRVEAERLRRLSPEETLAMGFSLMRFARSLSEAASRARN